MKDISYNINVNKILYVIFTIAIYLLFTRSCLAQEKGNGIADEKIIMISSTRLREEILEYREASDKIKDEFDVGREEVEKLQRTYDSLKYSKERLLKSKEAEIKFNKLKDEYICKLITYENKKERIYKEVLEPIMNKISKSLEQYLSSRGIKTFIYFDMLSIPCLNSFPENWEYIDPLILDDFVKEYNTHYLFSK
jgi:Skp family chaperone for outer membrane proteins